MNKILFLLSAIFAIQIANFGQREAKIVDVEKVLLLSYNTLHIVDPEPIDNIRATTITRLELPKTNSSDIIISHTGYSFLYKEAYEQSCWIAYELTNRETNKIFNRTDKFISDPEVITGTANNMDYSGSGYDRGHLAPAADMGWSETSMAESFYYSNMSPQEPGFNRGIWKQLEELVRTWAVENESVYVVTGPVLTFGLSTIGMNKVSVPKYYYKVILDYTDPGIKGIGFILPNKGSKVPLQEYALTIDSVEKFTGIDFFPKLPDEQERIIESTITLESWSWKNSSTETVKDNKNVNATERKPQTDQATRKTASGQIIYTGPRGGRYHFSKSGSKVYERKE